MTRRVPVTVDEATADPPPVAAAPASAPSTVPDPANQAKATLLGASDLGQTMIDQGSIERMLAGLEWTAPPSEAKVPAAAPAPTPDAELTRVGVPATTADAQTSEQPTKPPEAPPAAMPNPMMTMVGGSPLVPPAAELARAPLTAPPQVGPGSGAEAATAPPPIDPSPMMTQLGGSPLAAPAPAPAAPMMTMVGGSPLAPPAPAPAPQPAPAMTQVGLPAAAPAPKAPAFGQTMLGGSISAADVMAESTRRMQAPVEGTPQHHKTMIGLAALDKAAFPAPAAAAPAGGPASQPDPGQFRPAFKTMLGVAVPGIAPIRDSERALLAAESAQLRAAPPTSHHAPVAPAAPPPSARMQPVPAIVPAPAPIVVEPLPEAPRVQPKKGVSAIAVVSIVIGLLVIFGGVAAVFVFRSGAPINAKARLDESGKESLEIRCESCPDQTTIGLGASKATVTAASAVLPLPAPLSIGDNDLEIAIDRPGAGRDEKVKVHVPIAYRVKADLTTLAAVPPVVTVRVEAASGTEVVVDGKPVALDAAGKGSYALDVSTDALGPSDDQKAIDRKIAFSVKRKGSAAPEQGTLVVRAAVVPLHMDAPGNELFTDRTTANIVGQTKPGGAVTVDGQAIALDTNGRFAIRAELPAEGAKTLTVVATAPPLAPRTVRAQVTRVASLENQAKAIDATTPLGFDAYGADPASKADQVVVINGEIVEIRSSPGYSVMLVEEKKSCASSGGCMVRLAIGEEVKAARGDLIRAYGHVAGTVAWNNKTVPSVTGSLAITTKGAVPKK